METKESLTNDAQWGFLLSSLISYQHENNYILK